jgi:hypothetical protein
MRFVIVGPPVTTCGLGSGSEADVDQDDIRP